MKWMLYGALLAAAVFLAPEGNDVGKLKPIEIVAISRQDDMIVIETDTEDYGRGLNVAQAVQDLKERSSGIVMLKTAEYLLLEEGTEGHLTEIKGELKGNVRVCRVKGEKDLVSAAEYLNIHKPNSRLKHAEAEKIEEILVFEENEKEKSKKMKIMLDK